MRHIVKISAKPDLTIDFHLDYFRIFSVFVVCNMAGAWKSSRLYHVAVLQSAAVEILQIRDSTDDAHVRNAHIQGLFSARHSS